VKTLLRGKPLAVRFWAHVEMRGPDDCWVFKGPLDRNGYGRFQQGKTNHAAHRLAWILANGREFPPNTVGMHTCDNPPCVNPAHVRPATVAENNRDMFRKRRHAFGERKPNAKLTEADVKEIVRRRKAGEKARLIADDFNVSDSLVCAIAAGKKWPHLVLPVAP
jgi:hypothetical protein